MAYLRWAAKCLHPGCLWNTKPPRFDDYLTRQQAVGEHRLTTGHTVQMWTR
jgi:hypothetical protein